MSFAMYPALYISYYLPNKLHCTTICNL